MDHDRWVVGRRWHGFGLPDGSNGRAQPVDCASVAVLLALDVHLFSSTHRKVDHENREGKVIHAEGEFQASQKLADAAEIIAKHPMALHLRFLQSLVEVSPEKNSTIIFPVHLDLLAPFLKKSET